MTAPLIENDAMIIDLRHVMMEVIEKAAQESPWVPAEYYMNEVVSDVCAFLRAPQPSDALEEKVAVKPLVWARYWPGCYTVKSRKEADNGCDVVYWAEKSEVGGYVINTITKPGYFRCWTERGDKYPTIEAAKAAAQADYTARILAALEPAPLTVADALTVPEVRALVEALEYILDGYGLNPPDFRQTETDEDGETVQDDWVVAAARAALRGIEGQA